MTNTTADTRRPSSADAALSADHVARYSRQILLPKVGQDGQERLARARVAVVGMGGLGSPAALYLAAAGVGTIGLIDDDVVELSNLQRQVIHRETRIGEPKVDSAIGALSELNSTVRVVPHPQQLTADNALEILADYDVVVDGTDNYQTRYLVSDACVLLGKPLVWGSVFQFEGQVSVWWPPHGPCYRCAFPEPPAAGTVPSCAEGGVLGVVCGSIGTAQVTEAVKLILGIGEPAVGKLLIHDALSGQWDSLSLARDPECAICGPAATIDSLADSAAVCRQPDPEPTIDADAIVSAEELADLLENPPPSFRLIDVRNDDERALVSLPGAEPIHLSEFDSGTAMSRLHADDDVVIYCRSGGRSGQALRAVPPGTVRRVRHLEGGLQAWTERVDPTLPRY